MLANILLSFNEALVCYLFQVFLNQQLQTLVILLKQLLITGSVRVQPLFLSVQIYYVPASCYFHSIQYLN